MSSMVNIKFGSYRGVEFTDETFEMVQDVKEGAKGFFVTVRPNDSIGFGNLDKIRVAVADPADVVYLDGTPNTGSAMKPAHEEETDEVIMERIAERFDIMEEMTRAAMSGNIRGMIVSGPPGVGKSYGITAQLEKSDLFSKIKSVAPTYEVIKGAMTPIGLYTTLYNYSDPNNVLVFDDCDSILFDELALNLLKAALDSGKKRKLYWNSDSSYLRKEGIPNSFEFKGSVIFITNVNFDNVRSKKLQDHLAALKSRCHYIDTAMHTERDKILRIKQIHATGALLDHYHFQNDEGDQVINFMLEHKARLNEISLRMATKIADLVKLSPERWKRLAETTCMKGIR